MAVERLAEGLWRWTVPHPQWREGQDWDRVVGCVYCETPGAVVVIDPLVPQEASERERFWRALDGDVERLAVPVVVLLTCRWHVRSAAALRDRYGARVLGPSTEGPSTEGPSLAGVVSGVPGDGTWPVEGIQAFSSGMPHPEEEFVYCIAAHRAVVPGDVLLGRSSGVRVAPPGWYSGSDGEREWYAGGLRRSLRRLVALDPEMLLVAHGEPVRSGAAAVLAAALDAPSDA